MVAGMSNTPSGRNALTEAASRLNRAHAPTTITADFDPGPVPPPTASDREVANRVRAIAAIHALAQWLTDNPDAPIPWSIEVNADPRTAPAAVDQERIDALDAFADAHGAERTKHGPHHFALLKLARIPTHGVEINYIMTTTQQGQGR